MLGDRQPWISSTRLLSTKENQLCVILLGAKVEEKNNILVVAKIGFSDGRLVYKVLLLKKICSFVTQGNEGFMGNCSTHRHTNKLTFSPPKS